MSGSCREPDAIDDDRVEVMRMNRWMWCVLIVVGLPDRPLRERGVGAGVRSQSRAHLRYQAHRRGRLPHRALRQRRVGASVRPESVPHLRHQAHP